MLKNNFSRRRRRKQAGFGLLDIMISMGIVAGILLLVFSFARAATNGTNTNSTFGFLEATHSAAVAWRKQSGLPDYSLVTYRIVTNASGAGANPEGGNCTLAPDSSSTGLIITLSMIDQVVGARVANAFGSSFATGKQGAEAIYSPNSRTLTVTYEQ